ncbi:MAG TPA: hypothetical protein VNV25_22395 [Gemmatimonadaceae bacterium]|jgi:hypothetical protein|nr:hypothetical protein [Gemmatimonadaceae bacterium]
MATVAMTDLSGITRQFRALSDENRLRIEAVEKRVAGSRPGWPNALYAIPVATIASGLAFAVVDSGHPWWRDGLAELAWGTAAAVIGRRRWNARAAQTATVGEAPR